MSIDVIHLRGCVAGNDAGKLAQGAGSDGYGGHQRDDSARRVAGDGRKSLEPSEDDGAGVLDPEEATDAQATRCGTQAVAAHGPQLRAAAQGWDRARFGRVARHARGGSQARRWRRRGRSGRAAKTSKTGAAEALEGLRDAAERRADPALRPRHGRRARARRRAMRRHRVARAAQRRAPRRHGEPVRPRASPRRKTCPAHSHIKGTATSERSAGPCGRAARPAARSSS